MSRSASGWAFCVRCSSKQLERWYWVGGGIPHPVFMLGFSLRGRAGWLGIRVPYGGRVVGS